MYEIPTFVVDPLSSGLNQDGTVSAMIIDKGMIIGFVPSGDSQETVGYFFCLEDTALLCRKCDVAIHTVNTLVSSHQRFLLTGVKVGLEAADLGASSSTGKSYSCEKIPEAEKPHSLPGRSVPMSATSQFNKVMPVQAAGAGDFLPFKMPFAGGSSAESIQQWQFDDFLGLADFSQKL